MANSSVLDVRRLGRAVGLIALAFAAAACGDDVGASIDAAPASADPDAGSVVGETPPGSCAQPGDPGNDIGVGAYCSPGGGQCSGFTLAPLCIADAAPDQGQWFCTRLCNAETNCGAGAFCLMAEGGSACVPDSCEDPRDAGPGGAM